jgi:two-component system sensor histidine kinase/response regulator
LLIDDGEADRAVVRAGLAGSNLDYTLVEREDAASGLAAATADNFDCVLLDAGFALPDLLTRLTSAEGGRQAVIALTDETEPDDALALLRAGALDSISRSDATPRVLARAIRYAKARRGFVIELQAAREDAEAKTRALDRLNRQTKLILSIIAHDLRNPFQILLGMTDVLVHSASARDTATTARRAADVHEAADQAHGLMESLFDWASLHMDARTEPAATEVGTLFSDCAHTMQEPADAKGVRLRAEAGSLSVLAQENATAAILRNLVANALKFTAPGGSVTLSAEPQGECVAIVVADTGVGMSEAQIANLFRHESRSSSLGTSGERGAGLGLLLCRDLAEWIGATLEVESRVGEGTTFRLILPAA